MKFDNKNFLSLVFVLFICPLSAQACTTFVLNRNNTILLAKNLDWPIGEGIIIVNKKGETKHAFSDNNKSFHWQSRYGSITFNQFGKEFPLGGINEEGLVIEELNYSLSKYPSAQKISVNEFQWIQYQLDNFSTVTEVLENIYAITIVPQIAKLHYMVCDRAGRVAIIDFIDGNIQYYTDKDVIVPVLTNNSYSNSLKYLKYHKGFGGSRIVSDGSESPERFVRAATLLKSIDAKYKEQLHDNAFQILDAVSQDDTQWSIVYDTGQTSIYFRTNKIVSRQKIALSDFDFWGPSKVFNLCLNDLENQNLQFHDYSDKENIQLIRGVFEKLINLDELSKDKAEQLLKELNVYYQTIK